MSFKQNTINQIAIGVADTAGNGVTGLLFTDVAIKIAKAGGAAVTKTLSAPDWVEAGQGWYWLKLSAADCDTLGSGAVLSSYSGAQGQYPFDVVANLAADVFTRLGSPAGASIAADIAAVLAMATHAVRAGLGLYVRFGVPVYNDETPDLATVRVRLYDTKAHHDADDGVTGLVVPEFTRTVTYGTELVGFAHQILTASAS